MVQQPMVNLSGRAARTTDQPAAVRRAVPRALRAGGRFRLRRGRARRLCRLPSCFGGPPPLTGAEEATSLGRVARDTSLPQTGFQVVARCRAVLRQPRERGGRARDGFYRIQTGHHVTAPAPDAAQGTLRRSGRIRRHVPAAHPTCGGAPAVGGLDLFGAGGRPRLLPAASTARATARPAGGDPGRSAGRWGAAATRGSSCAGRGMSG